MSIVVYLQLMHMVSGRKKEWDFMDNLNRDTDYDGMGDFSRIPATQDSWRYRQGRREDQVESSMIIAGWGLTMLIILIIMLVITSGF